MAVPAIPSEMMAESCASESLCMFGLSAMFGARSLPFPSSPWHAAQLDARICRPLAKADDSFGPGFTCWDAARGEFPAHAITTSASHTKPLRVMSIDELSQTDSSQYRNSATCSVRAVKLVRLTPSASFRIKVDQVQVVPKRNVSLLLESKTNTRATVYLNRRNNVNPKFCIPWITNTASQETQRTIVRRLSETEIISASLLLLRFRCAHY